MSKRRRLFRLETKHQPLASRRAFARRVAANFGVASLLVGLSLGAGMMGYHNLEDMPWIDAFVNAAMILTGMGPVSSLQTDAGKIFAGCYALYSGLILVL